MSIKHELWAKQTLSPARRRAFLTALAKLESERFSQEWKEAQHAVDEAVRGNEIHVQRFASIVWEQWSAQDQALEEQIRQLRQEQRQLASERDAKIQDIRTATHFHESEDLKALHEKASAIWKRDNEVLAPKIDALMAKYQKAQEASA